MINLDTLIGVLFSAGGIFSIGGFIKYRDWSRNAKLKNEETDLARLTAENKRAALDNQEMEEQNRELRRRLNKALDTVADYRGRLIEAGLLKVNTDDDS